METGLKKLLAVSEQEQKKKRKIIIISFITVTALFYFMLCLRTTKLGFIPVKDEIRNLVTIAKLFVGDIFNLPISMEKGDIIKSCPYYAETLGRLKSAVLTLTSGAVLSLAGAVYQNVFRNPIAAPSMLGISSGINIGILVLVMQFSASAAFMTARASLYCYIGSFAILFLVVVYGRFLGGRKFSVVEMLIGGSILTRILMEVINLLKNFMTEEDLITLQELYMNGFGFSGRISIIIFVAVLVISLIPIFLMRFSLNAVCFPLEESKALGINTFWMSVISVICGTALVVTTIMYSGDIAMLALMIPHLSRYLFGVNFKEQYHSCILFGAGFLLICRLVTIPLSFSPYTQMFTLGTVVSLLTAPIFMFVLASGKRGWK